VKDDRNLASWREGRTGYPFVDAAMRQLAGEAWIDNLNSILQARRHDPTGDYVRAWVPELAAVRGSAVHEPWRLERSRRSGYPPPLVDHDEARRRFLSVETRTASPRDA
jgi:deoxyribodipyrimidine photolyase